VPAELVVAVDGATLPAALELDAALLAALEGEVLALAALAGACPLPQALKRATPSPLAANMPRKRRRVRPWASAELPCRVIALLPSVVQRQSIPTGRPADDALLAIVRFPTEAPLTRL